MKLKCPECGSDESITAEYYCPQWSPETEQWEGGDEITGPYVCQMCMFESKYMDSFIVEENK